MEDTIDTPIVHTTSRTGRALIQLFIELPRHIDRVRRRAGGIGADIYTIYIYIYIQNYAQFIKYAAMHDVRFT